MLKQSSLSCTLLLSVALLLSSCSSISDVDKSIANSMKDTSSAGVSDRERIKVDVETGCQYFSMSMTPRLNSKGIPICKETNKDIKPIHGYGTDMLLY